VQITVRARKHWTSDPLMLEGGEYEFRAEGCWDDMGIPSGPGGYDTPWWSPLQRLMGKLGWRRVPAAKWFALCGAVRRSGTPDHKFVIGTESRHELPAGHLYCFANDVLFFYWNNFGHVNLTVRRVR